MTTGVAQAEAHRDNWWWSPAMAGLKHLAASGVPFTAFDLSDQLGVPEPDHPCRWGALFSSAQRAGVIVRCGFTETRRPNESGRITRVWRGVPPG